MTLGAWLLVAFASGVVAGLVIGFGLGAWTFGDPEERPLERRSRPGSL